MKSSLLFSEDEDETAEENDEDFNFMAFEEELDQEEFRYDKAVKVTRKLLKIFVYLSLAFFRLFAFFVYTLC